jgi:hypothetical protein
METTMSLEPAELASGQALHELLSLHVADEATGEVRQLATVGVQGLGAETTQVLGRKLSEWSNDQLKEQLRDAFDVDPFALMLQAWSQVRKVHKAAKESLGPPPATRSVPLLQHEIDLKVEPRLVLNVSGIDWCSVQLALTLKFSFESVVLELMGGQLTGLKLGNPTGALSFACEGHDVAQFKRDIKLHASYAFNPPLAWPAPALSISSAGAVAAAH